MKVRRFHVPPIILFVLAVGLFVGSVMTMKSLAPDQHNSIVEIVEASLKA